MDPLSALRDYTTRGDLDRVVLTNDEIHFGSEYIFPASSPTAFLSKQGSFYPLHALLFFLRNQHLKHADYVQSTILHRVPGVTLPDRKPLLDYLHSLVPSSDSVHHLPPLPQPQPSSSPTPVPAQPDVDAVDMIKVLERPLKDREALLECKGKDFYAVLVSSTKREEERARTEGQQRKDGLIAKSRLLGSDEPKLHLKAGKVGDGVPIILVPSASQTLVTIYNVREFLEDGVYVPVDVKVKEMRGAPKPDCITVQKKLSRDRVVSAYEVRDKPSALKKDDWERVVAVFVLGKEWQFKDWPFKDHVEIFNKIIGFYVRFEDDSVESAKNVKQWNVKIISISKNKRHQDRAAALEVWDRLEAFMRSRSHT